METYRGETASVHPDMSPYRGGLGRAGWQRCRSAGSWLLCRRAGLLRAGLISSAGLHGDALTGARGDLGQPQPEDAVFEVGCAGLAVHLAGQREPVVEATGPASLLLFAFALFGRAVLAADPQVLALQIDRDVIGTHTGQICFDQVRVLRLLDVYRWRPGVHADPGHIGKRVGQHPAHLFEQVIERDKTSEGVPTARAVTSPPHRQCHLVSPSANSTQWCWTGSVPSRSAYPSGSWAATWSYSWPVSPTLSAARTARACRRACCGVQRSPSASATRR